MSSVTGGCTIRPTRLLCEQRENPTAIQTTHPRFSWNLEAVIPTARNLKQIAYSLQVATSPEFSSDALVWASQRVDSDEMLHIDYAGESLRSGQQLWWRVQVWDQNNVQSFWSAPATFTMGLLNQTDWAAAWMEAPDPLHFDRCYWVWHSDEPNAHQSARAGKVAFRKHIDTAQHGPVQSARMILVADDTWRVLANGRLIAEAPLPDDNYCHSTCVDLTEAFQSGSVQCLVVHVQNHTSGTPAGLMGKVVIRYADQTQQVLIIDHEWEAARMSLSTESSVDQADLRWLPACRLEYPGATDPYTRPLTVWGTPDRDDALVLPVPPLFEASFELAAVPPRALLHVAALGCVDMQINGMPVSPKDDRFTPGWPDYHKRIFAVQYDVTALLRPGRNQIRVLLTDGWHSGYLAWGRRRNRYDTESKFILLLAAPDATGTLTTLLASGPQWRVSTDGPVRQADMLMGEMVDGTRRDEALWNWAPAALSTNVPDRPIQGYADEPVRPMEHVTAIGCSEPRPGHYVYDLGQNIVGVVRLVLPADVPNGTRITIRHAEVLTDDGMPYVEALRGAVATDSYVVASTNSEQIFEPRSTFHGFRYVELTSDVPIPRLPLTSVVGIVLHSGFSRAGDITTSDIQVNRLYQNILWGQRGNSLEIPTDCPQRDERLGWTGDAQIFIRTATFNYDVGPFFSRYCQAMTDGVTPDGWYRMVAPVVGMEPNDEVPAHGWSDAGIICPYVLWQAYGDLRPARDGWTEMGRFMDYLVSTSTDLIRPDYGYGDWLSLNADTPKDLLGTAYFAWDASLMAAMAQAMGLTADHARYAALYHDIRAAFRKRFVGGGGWVAGNTQTGYALALRFGLLEDSERPLAVAHLARDIAYRGGHFSTGFMGLRDVVPALSDGGKIDLVYRMLKETAFPSWGYEIQHGATTIWERWDGWNEELGLQTPEMNSFNHYSLGSVGEWMFRVMAGIDCAQPGYKRIRIAPQPHSSLQFVRASYRSAHGWIGSEWRIGRDSTLTVNCSIPPGTTAEVHIPCSDAAQVTELSGALPLPPKALVDRGQSASAVFELGSGHYSFRAPWSNR